MKKAIQMTCLFISIFSQSQIDCTFNLSLIDADLEYRKIEKNEEIHIYIKNQHFLVSKSSIDFISQSDLKKINLKTINGTTSTTKNTQWKMLPTKLKSHKKNMARSSIMNTHQEN